MKKEMSSHAAAAKAIRIELKKAFPGVQFKVRSESYSGGNAVRIHWIDGITVDQVDAIVSKYEYGHFNSMEDIYEYSNCRNDIPQVKYVTTDRDISEVNKQKVKKEIEEKYQISLDDQEECRKFFQCWPDQVLYREMRQRVF